MDTNNIYSKTICVFCGSRAGNKPAYAKDAASLGRGMAERNWSLIYGAGGTGIMGTVAEAVQQESGQVVGVIPLHLVDAEAGKTDLKLSIKTENMHERKKVMFTNSDAIILLPGGVGSLEEFFEVLTWAQLDLHKKPIIIVNVDEFWDPLLSLINHVIEQGFAAPSLTSLFVIQKSSEDALAYLESRFS